MPDESRLFRARDDDAPTIGDWPMFGLEADVRGFVARAMRAGEAVVVATLVAAEGGGPRRPGAQMAVTENALSGFLSGGCIEGDVVMHARDCLRDGRSRRLVYGEGSPWFDIRLLCGRRIELFVERLTPADAALGRLLALTAARREVLWLSDGRRRLCLAEDETIPDNRKCPPVSREDAGTWPGGVFIRYRPAVRLMVHGRDPSALALASLGVQAGFETTLVRRDGPPTPPPLAGVAYRRDLPVAADLDPRTAVVVANHDPEADEAAVLTALGAPAGYIGLLGARAHLDAHHARLIAAGVAPNALAHLKAPVGLPLNSHTPWEIAVSVIAEIMQVFNSPTAAGGSRIDFLPSAS